MLKTVLKNLFFRNYQIIFFVIFFCFLSKVLPQKLVVGYYPHWLKTTLPASNIQFENLTHVIHSFAWPTASGEIKHYAGMIDPNLNSKVHQENRKILLAFGGAGNSDGFGPMSVDSNSRISFVNNVYDFLTINNYDGIDIDWEFPKNIQEKKGLTQLVKELRKKFESNNSSLLITMAVGASNWSGQHFEFEKMEEYIDWFAMMGYDISGSWSSISGHNAPLFKGQNDWSWNDGYNYLHSTRSISNKKILLGMPFYGKQFNTTDIYKTHSGTVTNLRYNEVVPKIVSGSWEYIWDEQTKVPYLLNNDRTKFITYDDTNAVKEKVKYVLEKNVAGVMIWALGQDVVGDSQPLLEVIGKIINATTSIVTRSEVVPEHFKLYNNYPNPFNPSTKIKFDLVETGVVNLRIFNINGEVIKILIKEQKMEKGKYEIIVNMNEFASNIFFYQLQQGCQITLRKMILVK